MKLLNTILAQELRQGRVTVEIPGLDMDRLSDFLHSEAARTINEIAVIACSEEMTVEEKVSIIQEKLA